MSYDSSSQDPSFIRREPADQPESSASLPEANYLSSLLESGQAPGYQQGAFLTPISPWALDNPRPTLESASDSAIAFQIPLHPQNSATSNSSARLAGSILDPAPSHTETAQQISSGINCGERLTENGKPRLEDPLHPGPMSVAAAGYLTGPMQSNPHQYIWGNRPYQPNHPPSGTLSPQFPPSQSYQSAELSVGYSGNPSGPMHGYHDSLAQPSYLPGAPSSGRQNQSRSPQALMPRPFPPHPASPLPNQPLMASPPYMMSQPGYYLLETPPIPPSHQTSMSPHSSPMLAEPIFATADPLPPATDSDHPVRVVSSRPRPQCWEHGCNGREFSTFSNLLRHQREKSGVVAKAECPVCGAVFTRTTARNIHVAQGKCKGPGQDPSAE